MKDKSLTSRKIILRIEKIQLNIQVHENKGELFGKKEYTLFICKLIKT